MQFCDEVKVTLMGGKGGNGCVSFRREKYVPRGGPDGGNGGDGASVYLVVDTNINTLSEFNTYKTFRGDHGISGKGSNMAGRAGEDLMLKVPPGTMVFDSKDRLLIDLREVGEKICIAQGGKGGYGNSHFAKATRQAPSFAEKGEPGKSIEVRLELKLVADVGVIGIPSVGKSSFIARVSSARPKIADYPFTTLVPNLGVCYLSTFGGEAHESFVVCDLPGLIENAHLGKGLGIEFLKHIMRNRILLHLLDGSREDIVQDYDTIRNELGSYKKELLEKPEIVAINKTDIMDEERLALQKQYLLEKHPELADRLFFISSATGNGLKECIFRLFQELQKVPKEAPAVKSEEEEAAPTLYQLTGEEDPRRFRIDILSEKDGKTCFQVKGKRIEQVVVMTDMRNDEAVSRVYDVISRHGILRALLRNGAREGDEIKIGDQILPFHEDME